MVQKRKMSTTQKVTRQIRAYNELGSFRRLKRLIGKLSDKEIEIVFAYLNAFDVSFGKTETKTSQLLRYLLENPEATEELAAEHFGIAKLNTFEKLAERLRDKIGYCLTNEINTQREGEYSERYKAIFLIQDKMKRAEVYLGKKGLPEEAYFEISKVIQLAKAYEVYSPLIDALYMRRNFLNLRQGTKGFAEATDEIRHYEKCRDAYLRARQWHNEYVQFAGFEGYRAGFTEMFGPALVEMSRDFAETRSASVGYFYYIIKAGYLQETRKFHLATDYALKLLNLVKDNKAIYMPWRMGTAYVHLADSYLCQRELEKSITAAQMAQIYYTPNTLNYSIADELEFFALFYRGEYGKAEKKMLSILQNTSYKRSEFIDNKRQYLYACALFALGKLGECARALETVKEIHNDKRGWNIGIRILSIMTTISRPQQEELTLHKLDALRKHVENLRHLKEARKRDLIVLKLLQELMKKNSNFEKVYSKRQEEFDLLESPDPETGWQIRSHELIIFPVWFKCMVKKTPYKVDLSAPSFSHLPIV
jgi:hypothetical protein